MRFRNILLVLTCGVCLAVVGCANRTPSGPAMVNATTDEEGTGEASEVATDQSSPQRIPTDPLKFTDIHSQHHDPFADQDTKAIVLVFIATDCPIANYFQPTISRMSANYRNDDVLFFVVHPDPELKVEAAAKHAEEFKTVAPVVLDSTQAIARLLGAKVTPEAHLIDRAGKVRYRGRINDLYADYGKRRQHPTRNDLRDAIESLLRGEENPPVTTRAIGCYIPFPTESSSAISSND